MIETLARAIYVSDWGADAEPWDPDLGTKQIYLDRARAVLKALETPTPELNHMLCVGSDTLCFEMGLEQIDHRGTVLTVFTAMIKAAQEQD